MKRIEIQCEECGTKEITFTDVTEEDILASKAAVAASISPEPLTDEELAMGRAVAQEITKKKDTHVMCSSCGHLTKKAP